MSSKNVRRNDDGRSGIEWHNVDVRMQQVFVVFFFFLRWLVVVWLSDSGAHSAYKPTSSLLIWFSILLLFCSSCFNVLRTEWKLKSSNANDININANTRLMHARSLWPFWKVSAHHVRFFFLFISTEKLFFICANVWCMSCWWVFVFGCAWSDPWALRHLHKHWIYNIFFKIQKLVEIVCGVRVALFCL